MTVELILDLVGVVGNVAAIAVLVLMLRLNAKIDRHNPEVRRRLSEVEAKLISIKETLVKPKRSSAKTGAKRGGK